jgi:hypothetical protein
MLEPPPQKRKRRASRPPWTKRGWPVALLVVVTVSLMVAGGVTVYHVRSNQIPSHEEFVGIAEASVQLQIPQGVRSAFSPDEETHVEQQGQDEYLVQGWADLFGSGGVSERQAFSCVVRKNQWGDWVGEQVTLIPQM